MVTALHPSSLANYSLKDSIYGVANLPTVVINALEIYYRDYTPE
jgi:hypothetical protein